MPIRSGSTITALSALLVGRVVLDDDDEGRCEDVEKDETTTAAPPTSTMDDADGNFIVYCKNNADVEYGSSNANDGGERVEEQSERDGRTRGG